MPYISPKQRANEAFLEGLEKVCMIIVAVAILRLVFILTGRQLAKWLYPHSAGAQKTLHNMWLTLGWCITIWASLRIAYM